MLLHWSYHNFALSHQYWITRPPWSVNAFHIHVWDTGCWLINGFRWECPYEAWVNDHYWITGDAGTINSLRRRQNGRRFADDTFKRIFLNENVRISIKISLKFVPKGPINNNPALVQIMARRRPGDKPLSESILNRLPTHICVTRPQWVNPLSPDLKCS